MAEQRGAHGEGALELHAVAIGQLQLAFETPALTRFEGDRRRLFAERACIAPRFDDLSRVVQQLEIVLSAGAKFTFMHVRFGIGHRQRELRRRGDFIGRAGLGDAANGVRLVDELGLLHQQRGGHDCMVQHRVSNHCVLERRLDTGGDDSDGADVLREQELVVGRGLAAHVGWCQHLELKHLGVESTHAGHDALLIEAGHPIAIAHRIAGAKDP